MTIKVLTSRTFRKPPGDSQGTDAKTDDLMMKLYLRSNSPCIKCLFLLFTGRADIQKSKGGRPRNFYETQLQDIPETK